jgi:tetratricopeptide (TPR) repeat protein
MPWRNASSTRSAIRSLRTSSAGRGRCERRRPGTLVWLVASVALAVTLTPALGEDRGASKRAWDACLGPDMRPRISACSELLVQQLSRSEQVMALSSRAVARRRLGNYEGAFADYAEALRLAPDDPYIRNNRAWAYYKSGQLEKGLADVEIALSVAAPSPPWLDTRAHLLQALGRPEVAERDYLRAMQIGGEVWVKRYQCGLRNAGVYKGEIDGRLSAEVRTALSTCVRSTKCDPLPDDEECRQLVS